MENKVIRVCVIGAGANGLCAAVQVQDMLEKRGMRGEVTVVAEKFNRETTSDGAAGMFNPRVKVTKSVPEELCRQWFTSNHLRRFRDSFHFLHGLATSAEAAEAGVQLVSGYEFYADSVMDTDPIYKELYYDIRDLSEKEMKLFAFDKTIKKGVFYTSLMVEGRWFLPWLLKKFEKKGGKVVKRKILSLSEPQSALNSFKAAFFSIPQLAGSFDIVVNCSGLGSNELVGDLDTIPIRGQVIRVKAPWVKHFVIVDGYAVYIMPGKETVIIGGTYQVGDSEENVRKEDTEKMWEVACQYMPCLKKAEWQWQWVGLRPHRTTVRLEREEKLFGEHKLQVVHNYGHGGNGMALCWGTNMHVCRLVQEALANRSKL